MKVLDYTGTSHLVSKTKTELANKVDKVAGKGLSTNDYTDADKVEVAKIDGIEEELSSVEAVTVIEENKTETININDITTYVSGKSMSIAGVESSSTTYAHTEKITVNYGDVLQVTNTNFTFAVVTAYNGNTAISDKGIKNVKEYTVPEGISHVIITFKEATMATSIGIIIRTVNSIANIYADDVDMFNKSYVAKDVTLANHLNNSRFISSSETWNSAGTGLSYYIPLDGVVKIDITANAVNNAEYALLKDISNMFNVGELPHYANGYTRRRFIAASTSKSEMVGDAKYLYVRALDNTLADFTPTSVTFVVDKSIKTDKSPTFCFIDDDGKADALTFLEGVIDATRIPINIALITNGVGTATYSTWNNLRRLRNKGMVFVPHYETNITTMTDNEVIEAFENTQDVMQSHSMLNTNIWVYPNGATNASKTAIVKNYFQYAFSTQVGLNIPPINTFYLKRVDLDGTTLEEWKAWVDKAIDTNALCVFYGHAYREEYTDSKLADYIALVRYIAEKGYRVDSLPDALKKYANYVDGDVTIGCDGVTY